MSVEQMALVWKYDFGHAEQSIMLALADHAHDDGTEIRPSVARLAWKTGYEERQVQRILKHLRDDLKILVMTEEGGGRGKPNVYRFDWSKGVKKSPFKSGKRVTSGSRKGDIAKTPEPSSIEPPSSTEGREDPKPEPLAHHHMKRIYEAMKEAGFTITGKTKGAKQNEYGRLVARVQWMLDNQSPTDSELDALPDAYVRAYKIKGPATDAVHALNELRRQVAREEVMAEGSTDGPSFYERRQQAESKDKPRKAGWYSALFGCGSEVQAWIDAGETHTQIMHRLGQDVA